MVRLLQLYPNLPHLLGSGVWLWRGKGAQAMPEPVVLAQQPQAQEISGKLQQTPVAQWEKQQKPSMRETGGGVT